MEVTDRRWDYWPRSWPGDRRFTLIRHCRPIEHAACQRLGRSDLLRASFKA